MNGVAEVEASLPLVLALEDFWCEFPKNQMPSGKEPFAPWALLLCQRFFFLAYFRKVRMVLTLFSSFDNKGLISCP
jgi:hypothetical protein